MSRRKISPFWYLQALRRWLTRHSPVGEPRMIQNDGQTAVAWLPGQSKTLVVAFQAARKKSFRPYRLDFRDVAWDGGKNHVLFVADRCGSWYSRPGQRDQIAKMVREFATGHGIQTIWSIGGSMGGYGAILFSESVPFTKVIAFVPQLLLTEPVISTPNWAHNRPNITDAVVRDLVPILASTPCHVHVIYGDRDEDDLVHFNYLSQKLPEASNVKIVVVRGKGHAIAPWLHKRGQLAAVVNALWNDDGRALEDCSRRLETPLELTQA